MKDKRILLLFIVLSSVFLVSCNYRPKIKQEATTQVLIVGTIHGSHSSNPNYSYVDLLDILETFDSDVICVEIPPSYFRKRSYLHEMMLATVFGTEKHKEVYPIDWWAPGDDVEKRNEFLKTAEYESKRKQTDELVQASSIMQGFMKKFGSMDQVWDENKKGYEFFNGKEYNDYVREMYAISMAVYGDSPMNLSYETRNSKMLELINEVIKKNEGSRIIVLTGAEHKHFFDRALSKQEGIMVVDFKSLLLLKAHRLTENTSFFLDYSLAKGYFESSEKSGIDAMYHGAMISLVHGLGMDDDPSIIPVENIEQANLLINEWEKQSPNSAFLLFEKAWVEFLEQDYEQAALVFKSIANRLSEVPEDDQWFVKSFYFRNLGFVYDMLGERKKAINCYRECKIVCQELDFDEGYARSIYKDYDQEPYCRK